MGRTWWLVVACLMLALAACTGGGAGRSSGPGASSSAWPAGEARSFRSPDGRLEIALWTDQDGSLRYAVARDDDPVIAASTLALRFEDVSFERGLTITAVSEPRTELFQRLSVAGKRRQVSAEASVGSVVVSNEAGRELAVDVVVFDDAVAHRFRTLDGGPWVFEADTSSFTFDADTEMYAQAYDRPGPFTPASEAVVAGPLAVDHPSMGFEGWALPALFRMGRHWVLIAETGVDANSYGSWLVNSAGAATHWLRQPTSDQVRVDQVDGPGDAGPVVEPYALPWRAIINGPTLATVVESNTIELLGEPSQALAAEADRAWVRPGRVSWSWWSDSGSPTKPSVLRAFIDLAAEFGWEYSLIDANWDELDDATIEELVAYGRDRNVGIFLWYNSGGPHNEVTEAPRDRLVNRPRRRAEMAELQALGVAGIKVDFFHSDRRSMNAYALELLADAADHELLVNFHGITGPKGWHIMWPNLLTTEAVRGGEAYKFHARFPEQAARHNTNLVFTRNVVGPMDYTPITLSNSAYPRLTTVAHEMALGVLFESGLQHIADRPSAYRRLDDRAIDYLRRLPVVWDDIVLLDGRPGSHAVVARLADGGWWLAGVNGNEEPLTLELDLELLTRRAAGSRLPTEVGMDGRGLNDLVFVDVDQLGAAGERVIIEMAPRGGFFARPAS